jgi:hypothetical protein
MGKDFLYQASEKASTGIYVESHDFTSLRWIAYFENSTMLDYGVEKMCYLYFLVRR